MRRDVTIKLNVSRDHLESLFGDSDSKVKIKCKEGRRSEREDSSIKDHLRSQST